MIKLRSLSWEIILDYPGGPNVITTVRVRRQDLQRWKKGTATGEVTGFEMEEENTS